jgi:hypothetical protein
MENDEFRKILEIFQEEANFEQELSKFLGYTKSQPTSP